MTENLPVLEEKLREAITDELKRQASARPGELKVSGSGGRVRVDGEIDLDPLIMVVTGALAGGP